MLGLGTSLDSQHKIRTGKLMSKASALSDACLVHSHFGSNMIFFEWPRCFVLCLFLASIGLVFHWNNVFHIFMDCYVQIFPEPQQVRLFFIIGQAFGKMNY